MIRETFGREDGAAQSSGLVPAHVLLQPRAGHFGVGSVALSFAGAGRGFRIHGLVLATHAFVVAAAASATMAAGDRVITESTKATRCSQLPFVSGHSDCSREHDANAPSA